MSMVRKLISVSMLALAGSLLLPLVSLAVVSGTTYDTPSTTTTTPATIAEHATAFQALSRCESGFQSRASGPSRSLLGLSRILVPAKSAPSFFEGASYTPKVLKQMEGGVGEFHSFPESVTAFEGAGTVRPLTGGDGVIRQMLEIPGSYGSGGNGVFRFIKNTDGTINERLLVPTSP